MQARVRADNRWGIVIAFSGHEYIKGAWRLVPAGYEAEARSHEMLETLEDTPHTPDLAGMTDDELKAAAKDAGIPNYWSMGRARLLSELEAI